MKPDSSDPGIEGCRPIPIDADHNEICKPNDMSSDLYIHVRAFVGRKVDMRQPVSERRLTDEPSIFHSGNTQSGPAGGLTNNITINLIGGSSKSVDDLVTELLRAIKPQGKPGQEQE